MVTDFPTGNMQVACFIQKTWVEIFLHGIWSFPYFLQENLGTYENMGNTFLEWTPFESLSKENGQKIFISYNGTNYHNVGLVKCGFILAFWTIFILLVN